VSYQARKFVKSDYDKNDDWGKDIVRKILLHRGYQIDEKPEEDYDIDFVAIRNGEREFFEVEVKHKYSWTGREDYRFDTVSFLGRKKKWEHKGFWYLIICAETEALVIANSNRIYKDEYRQVKHVNTGSRRGLDEFYLVPKDRCYFFSINDFLNSKQ
jgi:hypothetical protein